MAKYKNRVELVLIVDEDNSPDRRLDYLTNSSSHSNLQYMIEDHKHNGYSSIKNCSIESVKVEEVGRAQEIAEEIEAAIYGSKGKAVDKIRPIIERLLGKETPN